MFHFWIALLEFHLRWELPSTSCFAIWSSISSGILERNNFDRRCRYLGASHHRCWFVHFPDYLSYEQQCSILLPSHHHCYLLSHSTNCQCCFAPAAIFRLVLYIAISKFQFHHWTHLDFGPSEVQYSHVFHSNPSFCLSLILLFHYLRSKCFGHCFLQWNWLYAILTVAQLTSVVQPILLH